GRPARLRRFPAESGLRSGGNPGAWRACVADGNRAADGGAGLDPGSPGDAAALVAAGPRGLGPAHRGGAGHPGRATPGMDLGMLAADAHAGGAESAPRLVW